MFLSYNVVKKKLYDKNKNKCVTSKHLSETFFVNGKYKLESLEFIHIQ